MLITRGDFIDVWSKLQQRGKGFIFSKLNPRKMERTKSAFNSSAASSSNWWIIPAVRQRWNELITGDASIEYEDYLVQKIFEDKSNLSLLSIGSGVCSHEIKIAKHRQFSKVVCTDLVQSLLEQALINARKNKLTNIEFICGDINNTIPSEEQFDVVFFHASLHHFYDIDDFIKETVIPRLKPNGYIIINEYVGTKRLQFPKHQINAVNKALELIPKPLRQRFKSTSIKNKFYVSGLIRMILADPSECVDSDQIIPVLHKYFYVIEEKPYGGNILMNVLKDIAHNFLEVTDANQKIINLLFEYEDQYLKMYSSDFLFGIYQYTKNNALNTPS